MSQNITILYIIMTLEFSLSFLVAYIDIAIIKWMSLFCNWFWISPFQNESYYNVEPTLQTEFNRHEFFKFVFCVLK